MTTAGDQPNPIPPLATRGEESPRSSLDWAREAGIAGSVIRETDLRVRAKRRRRSRRLAAGSAALVLLLAIGLWWRIQSGPAVELPAHPTAVVTKPARQELSDGSIVELNTNAHIQVRYTDKVRRIVLDQGEAHFQVAKNNSRPFIVVAGDVEARALGTAFSVQLGAKAVEVLVTEGRVAVDRSESNAPGDSTSGGSGMSGATPIATLDAGHSVVVALAPAASQTPVLDVAPAEIADRLSWRVPLLEFSGTSLAEALALFNQYSPVRIALADPQLGQLKLSGIVRADNTDTLLQLLHDLGLVEDRRTATEILLRKSPSRP